MIKWLFAKKDDGNIRSILHAYIKDTSRYRDRSAPADNRVVRPNASSVSTVSDDVSAIRTSDSELLNQKAYAAIRVQATTSFFCWKFSGIQWNP